MYRLLLLLLPRHRRLSYGDEMRDVFNAAMLASSARGGRWAAMRLWIREVAGMMKFALRDRFAPRPGRGWYAGSELRWAVRSLRSRGWAGVFAVGLLAVALAANGIVFAAVDALAINRTPYPDVDRVVSFINAREATPSSSLPRNDARELLQHAPLFKQIAAFGRTTLFLQGNGVSERVSVVNATPGLFQVLGVTPGWGRTFSAEDVRVHDSDVVVISEVLARTRFGSPEAAVDQTLDTTDVPLRIVGVMVASFRFPDGGVDVWRGLDFDGPLATVQYALNVIARLHDGQALLVANGALGARYDPASKIQPMAEPFAKDKQDRTRYFALLGAALCLLLTACTNAASLELVAAFGRMRGYAIQRALGASRSMLARVVLAEGVMLIGLALLAGWALAALGLDALVAELPRSYGVIPANPIDLDTRALWFMAAAAAVTWLVIAVPVLVFATGVNVLDVLKHGGRFQSGSRLALLFRQGLTAVQVALAVILLVGGLLYARTYAARISVDKGFDGINLASLSLILPPQDIPKLAAIRSSVLAQLAAYQGVEAVTADSPPPSGDSPMAGGAIEIDGAAIASPDVSVGRRAVSPGYLEMVGARLRSGRFLDQDDPASHVVISEPFARRFWPEGAVGHTFRLGPQMPVNMVVGVVAHMRANEDRYEHDRGLTYTYYVRPTPRPSPTSQPASPARAAPTGRRIVNAASAFISMTMKLDSPARLPEIIAMVRRDVPRFAVSGAMVSDTYRGWEAETRLQTTVITAFGFLSFVTALIGVYGVMMFLVAGRTRELGVRIALGATRRDVIALVLVSASRLSIGGAVAGLFGAVALSRFVEGQLFGVSVVDTSTYLVVTIVVIGCATVATWFPARRAARVDPAITLRSE